VPRSPLEIELLEASRLKIDHAGIEDNDVAKQIEFVGELNDKVIGISDVTFIAAGNTKSVDMGEISRVLFIDRFNKEIKAAAS
jgi:FMN-dependent NADH-azoreductase